MVYPVRSLCALCAVATLAPAASAVYVEMDPRDRIFPLDNRPILNGEYGAPIAKITHRMFIIVDRSKAVSYDGPVGAGVDLPVEGKLVVRRSIFELPELRTAIIDPVVILEADSTNSVGSTFDFLHFAPIINLEPGFLYEFEVTIEDTNQPGLVLHEVEVFLFDTFADGFTIGDFTVLGGDFYGTGSPTDELARSRFNVVPAPGALALLSTGVLCVSRRRR